MATSIMNAIGSFFSNMKNTRAVESANKAKDLVGTGELISNFKKQVIAEERWELPSETQADGGAVDQTGERKGAVVTLEDGKTRYLVRRILNEQDEGVVDVVITYASHMGPNWVSVDEKQVQHAKLEDYLDEGEPSKTGVVKLSETEDKKESFDVKLVKSDKKGDSIEGQLSQFQDKKDSSDNQKDSDDTASKL